MPATDLAAAPPPIRRKPSRAEAARATGTKSRGPATAEGKARSSVNGLVHGPRARRHLVVAALGEDEAERARATLDEAVAGLPAPTEPRIEKIEPVQRLAPTAANDDASSARPEPEPERAGGQILGVYRVLGPNSRASCWAGLTDAQREAALAAEAEEEAAEACRPPVAEPPRVPRAG